MVLSLDELKEQAQAIGYKLTKIRVKKPVADKPPERDLYVIKKGKNLVCVEGTPDEKEKHLLTQKRGEIKTLSKLGLVEIPEPDEAESEVE